MTPSRSVTVTVEVATPFATTGPVPVIVEFPAATAPAVKTTEPSALFTGEVIDKVLVSALDDASVQVEVPVASDAEQVPYEFVVPVFVAVKVGINPTTGLLKISFKVMVTEEVATPLAVTGPVPVIPEFTATAAPEVNTTEPSVFATGVRIERVLVSALVDERVQVETPEALDTEHPP